MEKIINVIRLVGKLISLTDGKGTLVTIAESKGKSYETRHLLDFAKIGTDGLSVGKKFEIVGSMYQDPKVDKYAVWVLVDMAKKVAMKAEDYNKARVVAYSNEDFDYKPPQPGTSEEPGKQGFGQIVLTDRQGHFFRGKVFNDFGNSLLNGIKNGPRKMPPLTEGSVVCLEGPVRKDAYGKNVTTAIIADWRATRVLKAGPPKVDAFAGIEGAQIPAELLDQDPEPEKVLAAQNEVDVF